MELTSSFLDLLQHFAPAFTAPTYHTFVVIVCGWVLSLRHRFITEVIFSGGKVGIGHWARFHRGSCGATGGSLAEAPIEPAKLASHPPAGLRVTAECRSLTQERRWTAPPIARHEPRTLTR